MSASDSAAWLRLAVVCIRDQDWVSVSLAVRGGGGPRHCVTPLARYCGGRVFGKVGSGRKGGWCTMRWT